MYYLEGNIGVGKTTLVSLLPRYMPELEITPEPREAWSKLSFGQSLLGSFYKEPKRWAYALETLTLVCRFQNQMREQSKINPERLLERSMYSGFYCFAASGHKNGFLTKTEWQIYSRWVNFILDTQFHPPYGFIYLKAKPEICFERTQKRNRVEERSISLEYLQQIDEAHSRMLIQKQNVHESLKSAPVLVLDCDGDFLKDKSLLEAHIAKIKEFILETRCRNLQIQKQLELSP